ncbi:MAG: PsbP-related protein [Polaribacter sp.]
MKKYLVIVIVCFLTFNLNSQIKNEIYEAEDYNIKYPVDWVINSTLVNGVSFAVTSPLSSKDDEFSENVNIIIQDLKGMNIDLNKYVSISKQQLLSIPKGEILESKRVKKKDVEYHSIVFNGYLEKRNLKIKQYYILKSGKAYVLTFTAIEKEYDLYIKIADKILNSFKLK